MGKLMKPLERFPLPPFLSLGLILIVLAFAIIVPVYLIMKYKQEITRICKTLLKPCLLMCLPKDGGNFPLIPFCTHLIQYYLTFLSIFDNYIKNENFISGRFVTSFFLCLFLSLPVGSLPKINLHFTILAL